MTFAESDVDVDGFQIRALTAGSGEPLVFIHGGGGLHLSKAHELLAERYRVIALEVPGFGNSAPNGRSGSFPELAATLVCAARKMGAERFKLWGTSFGGAVALWMAIGAPEAIETLVLEAPGAILPEGGIGPSSTLLDALVRPSRQETEAHLASLNIPTLVIFGTRDRVISPELGRVYREKMPNCHYVLVYDAGHEVAADRPDAFVSLVSDFLERREAFIVNEKSSLLHP
jgi:pimeloyl-ACP methyl ester carboxylesterase